MKKINKERGKRLQSVSWGVFKFNISSSNEQEEQRAHDIITVNKRNKGQVD